MKEIKMVQYGCGKMSKYTMRYAVEKKIKIVGAFDIDEKIIGKDVGMIFGSKKYGVKVQPSLEFEKFLQKNEVDVVIVTTMSLMSDIYDSLEICARNGVNAITTCEEAFYPQNSHPTAYDKIDKLALENGCTITGSGYQDVFWGNLISVIAGSTQKITKIKGRSSYNVEDYGIALARAHGAGLSLEDFEKEVASADDITPAKRKKLIESGRFLPSYMWNVNGWLASKLGLEVKSQEQKCVPQIARKNIKSSTLGMTIQKGQATGMSAVVTTKTKEGVIIEAECIGKVYDKNDFDCNDWIIEGEPTTQVTINRPQTVELTCASVINRIPEVLCAPAGFITTDMMPENNYKYGDMRDYFIEEECSCGCESGKCHCEDK